MFEAFEHTADVGLRIRAASLEETIAESCRGLFSLLVANLDAVRPEHTEVVTIAGDEPPLLMFDCLNELLYIFATRRLLFSQFGVERTADGLRVTAGGEPIDESRHRLEHEVKAITYHGLRCEPSDHAWLAEVILDI
jgi:SHS2 domain-containing protein